MKQLENKNFEDIKHIDENGGKRSIKRCIENLLK